MKTFAGKSSVGLLLCFAGLLSFAAPQARPDEEKDPPTRVARNRYIDGSVTMQPGGQGDWGSAARNRPVTIGDKIWVDKDSRAELQAGTAAIHLGSMTALSFLNLDQGSTQMRLAEGSVNFRVSELRQGDLYEVDAPNLAFTVKEAGAFRVCVNEHGAAARVTVIRGEGEVTAGGKTYEVHPGERAEFNGTENIQYSIEKAPGPDGLDRWAAERDLKEDRSVSAKYVSRDMVGYDDLDDYGDWRDEPEYGHVWYPREVAVGWAPYSYGYWNWVGPWGWTWVDYSPWGFAPYHYGRWNYFGGRWGWCPGPIYGPPVYGPAFVGFFGGGFGFGVGWLPLGFGVASFSWVRRGREFVSTIHARAPCTPMSNVVNTRVSHREAIKQTPPTHNAPAMNGRFNTTPAPSQMTRKPELSQNRPPSAMSNSNRASASVMGNATSQRAGNSPRTWEAQGSATDRGRAPAGFGNSNRPTTTTPAQTARMSDTNRPPWVRGGGEPTPSNGQSSRPSAPSYNSNRPSNSNNGRAYEPPQRSQPSNNNRGYSQQPRSYSAPPSRSYSEPRTYSAPSRSYPAQSRSYSTPSYSAPSRSYSGG